MHRVGQFDAQGVVGGMAYGAAVGAPSPEVCYQPGPELEQLNLAWFPHVQLDGMHHHGGTSVYFFFDNSLLYFLGKENIQVHVGIQKHM